MALPWSASRWENDATAFSVSALILLCTALVMLLVRLVAWPAWPARFNTHPHRGLPRAMYVPLQGGQPGQVVLVQTPGEPPGNWHWSTRPNMRAGMGALQILVAVLNLSALSANVWSVQDNATPPSLYFGVFSFFAGSNTVSYSRMCREHSDQGAGGDGCSVVRAAGALTFLCSLLSLFTSVALASKMVGMCCAPRGNLWTLWMPRAARAQSVLLLGSVLIWSIVAHVALEQVVPGLLFMSSWSISLVCFLFSLPLGVWYHAGTQHRPDGFPLNSMLQARVQPQGHQVILVAPQQPQQQQMQQPQPQGQYMRQQVPMQTQPVHTYPYAAYPQQQPPPATHPHQPGLAPVQYGGWSHPQPVAASFVPAVQPIYAVQVAPVQTTFVQAMPVHVVAAPYPQQVVQQQPATMLMLPRGGVDVAPPPYSEQAQEGQPHSTIRGPHAHTQPMYAQPQRQPPQQQRDGAGASSSAAAAASSSSTSDGFDPVIKPLPPRGS